MHKISWTAIFAVLAGLCLSGCHKTASSAQIDFGMGDKVLVGPLTYTVIDAAWQGQLGEGYKTRTPEQRFLLLTVSVTNSGGKELSVPLLQLESASGQTYTEIANGEGVDQWFGLLRNVSPAQTLQGKVVFDVPLTSYRLRLTDGGDPGFERYAWVQVPLHIDTDTSVVVPLPGEGSLK
jgi:hypothetical protein